MTTIKSTCILVAVMMLLTQGCCVLLDPVKIKPFMFTEQISGNVNPLKPSKLGKSKIWPLPIETYEIDMKRTTHQFLPSKFPATQIFAYGGKVNGKFQYSFPGPAILSFKNTPTYIIWSNSITGKHFLPVDTSPPFDMAAEFYNEVPTVPHLHGLETEIGSDGEPMAFWTPSGRRGPNYFSLNSKKVQKNQAIYRYMNTKEGLFWFHDHAMGITRLNVYAGLVGLYEIIEPSCSDQQRNIANIYGVLSRKYFAIVDKSFNTDGSLYYPDKSSSSLFKSWVPEFFGNTITVNGKVWPKITLQPKKYRFVFLNGCQSRYINLYFENNGQRLNFDLFRRDSSYLARPITLKEHLLLIAGRIEVVIDLTNVKGEVLVRNSGMTPLSSTMAGTPVNEFTSQIMKIIVKSNTGRNLQQDTTVSLSSFLSKKIRPVDPIPPTLPEVKPSFSKDSGSSISDTNFGYGLPFPISGFGASIGNSIQSLIEEKMSFLDTASSNTDSGQDYIDEAQKDNQKYKVISIQDFINSNNNADQIYNSLKNDPNPAKTLVKTLAQKINNYGKGNNDLTISSKGYQYPAFRQGTPYFPILIEVNDNAGQVAAVMIDGVPLSAGCAGSVFKEGQVYDFYIINLTMDDHPMHIHLVNFQVIGRFGFDSARYLADHRKKNGVLKFGGFKQPPQQIDPRPYRNTSIEPPTEDQKLFLDTIRVPSGKVTIARVKIANHEGNRFPFEIARTRYVWHCHILEHEDNEMMRYFCIE